MGNVTLTKPLSRLGQIGRSLMKRFMYSQLAIFTGLKIAIGKEHPLVRFTVENDPPSIYWVFRIKSSEVEGLAQKLGIPSQFSLSPIKCLDTDEPAYLLTLNAYRVSGLANGLRAEWSVFIRDAENTPRYLVLDARSSQFSVDPIDIITKASTVIHERRDGKLYTQIGEGDQAFRSTITFADLAFYDIGLANTKQNRIGKEYFEIKDGSFWSQFVEPEPAHVLVLQNSIEFVISPWENVDRTNTR